jgi:hypothetical protein
MWVIIKKDGEYQLEWQLTPLERGGYEDKAEAQAALDYLLAQTFREIDPLSSIGYAYEGNKGRDGDRKDRNDKVKRGYRLKK